MPRIRVSLITLGLTLALTLLAGVADAQLDIRNRTQNAGKARVEEPTTTPAPTATPPAPAETEEPRPGEGRSSEARRGSQQTDPEEIKARIAQMDLASLLEVPQIAEELKVTERQKAQLKVAGEANSQNRRMVFQQMRESGGAFGFDPGAMRETMAALQQEGQTITASVLSTTQRTRLNQIFLQAKGPLAIPEPALAAQLRLTDLQLQQIQTVMQQMQMELSQVEDARRALSRQSRDRGEGGREGEGQPKAEGESRRGGQSQQDQDPQSATESAREKSQKVKEKAIQQIARILSASQRNSYTRLLGSPFSFEGVVIPGGRGGSNEGGRGGSGGSRGGPGGFGGPGGPRGR